MIIIHAPPRLHDKQFCFLIMVVNLLLHPTRPMNHYFKKIYKKERVGMDKKNDDICCLRRHCYRH